MKRLLLGILPFFLALQVQAEIIQVGTGNTYKPFTYVSEKNQAVGFDIDLLKILQKHDASLEFHFQPLSFTALFVGLDSGKFDMLAHQIAKTKEREEKYIFSDFPYFNVFLNFIVAEGAKVQGFEDLKNAKIGAVVGSNQALRIEEWAKKNAHLNVKIAYFKNYGAQLLALANKQVDALLDNPIVAKDYADAQGVKIQVTDLTVQKTQIFFVFPKNKVALKDKVSNALQKARAAGELKVLSEKYFNQDYTQQEQQQ